MYYCYKKINQGDKWTYELKSKEFMFGCKNGMIPYFMTVEYAQNSEPLKWSIDVNECIKNDGREDGGTSYLIDLKPYQKDNISLYEIIKVIGYSHGGWTPIMLVLAGLLVDEDPNKYDKKQFTISKDEIDYPIFSLMYLRGSIENGNLTGTWNTAGRAAANALLLWPDDFDYFNAEKNKITFN